MAVIPFPQRHSSELTPLSQDELAAEGGTALPDKELISLLDFNLYLDLSVGAAVPFDLAVTANANAAGPIAAAAAIDSPDSTAHALADPSVHVDQAIVGSGSGEQRDEAEKPRENHLTVSAASCDRWWQGWSCCAASRDGFGGWSPAERFDTSAVGSSGPAMALVCEGTPALVRRWSRMAAV